VCKYINKYLAGQHPRLRLDLSAHLSQRVGGRDSVGRGGERVRARGARGEL